MYEKATLFLVLFTLCACESIVPKKENPKMYYYDTYSLMDRPFGMSNHPLLPLPLLAPQFFFPWTALAKLPSEFEAEDLENSRIDPKVFKVSVNVRSFKPQELKVTVKDRYAIVEGKHTEENKGEGLQKGYFNNHFVQRYSLPPGVKPEEVNAVLNENGALIISAPKHEVPPPLPERNVPIQVIEPSTTRPELFVTSKYTLSQSEDQTDRKNTFPQKTQETTLSPTEHLQLVEATTHGKIKKKELKMGLKETKQQPYKRVDSNNVLDYTLMDAE